MVNINPVINNLSRELLNIFKQHLNTVIYKYKDTPVKLYLQITTYFFKKSYQNSFTKIRYFEFRINSGIWKKNEFRIYGFPGFKE